MNLNKIKNRPKAFLLGVVFTFLIVELMLRLLGTYQRFYWQTSDSHSQNVGGQTRSTVLFVGNSHTMGTGAPKGKSYPDQFRDKAAARGVVINTVNVAVANANSTFLRERLRENLELYKPKIVVMMVGEPNQWNHYGFRRNSADSQGPFATAVAQIFDLAYSLRVFRMIGLLYEFNLRPKPKGLFGDRTAEVQALYWISALDNKNMLEVNKLDVAQIEEAILAVEALLKIAPAHPSALWTLGELLSVHPRRSSDASQYWWQLVRSSKNQYQFRVDFTLNLHSDLPSLSADSRALAAYVKKNRPQEFQLLHDFFAKSSLPDSLLRASAERRIEFFGIAKESYPAFPPATFFLVDALMEDARFNEAIDALERLIEINPFSNQGNAIDRLLNIRELLLTRSPNLADRIERIIDRYRVQYPQDQDRFSIVDSAAILRWTQSDLIAMIRSIREHHAVVVLQTYPPMRGGAGRAVDDVIREVAVRERTVLVDTTRRFFGLEPDPRARLKYFTTMYGNLDNHLGESGYEVIADQLVEAFVDNNWFQ